MKGCSQFSIIPAVWLWGACCQSLPFCEVTEGPLEAQRWGATAGKAPAHARAPGTERTPAPVLSLLTAAGCLIKGCPWFPAAKWAPLPSAPRAVLLCSLYFPLAPQPPLYLRQSSPIVPSSQRARRGGVIQMPSDISEVLIKGRLCMPFEL